MWFEQLTGFREKSPTQVRKNISLSGNILTSRVNKRQFSPGILEIPSLGELRSRVLSAKMPTSSISVREEIADVQDLHRNKNNSGAFFQVASQFNLLEMVSPEVTPEKGIDRYDQDHTQGPTCAIAAGSGTIYRNYFAKVHGKIGQSADNQIDCLADIGSYFGNTDKSLWEMKNGYALATRKGLETISRAIESMNETELNTLRERLRIGIQWNTEVTIGNSGHTVTQAYCSALPVAYSRFPLDLWATFAQTILEASYEATICAGILNFLKTDNNTLYLTLIGGGVFGNPTDWILSALHRALQRYIHVGLDIVIVSHARSNPHIQKMVQTLQFED